MEFSTWVHDQPRGTLKRIEREARVGYTTLHRLMRGERIDSYSLAKRVSDATGGVVTVADLCGEEELGESRRSHPCASTQPGHG